MRVLLFLLVLSCDAFVNVLIKSKKCNKLCDTYLDYELMNGLGIAVITIPKFIKHKTGNCNIDNDCPWMQRCCKVGDNKYCCNPNNYLNVDYAHNKQISSYNTTEKIYI